MLNNNFAKQSISPENTKSKNNTYLKQFFMKVPLFRTIYDIREMKRQIAGAMGSYASIAERMASDDKTTTSILERLEDIAEQIENTNKAICAINQVAHMNPQGIDLPETLLFNMLDKKTNAQAGEDSILAYILATLNIPFSKCSYLDLGANHAKEMSNTYFFYSQGASGVLVEANPELIPELRLLRPHDIVLNQCIDIIPDRAMNFYIFNIDGLSTPNKDDIEFLLKENKKLRLKETITIKSITVNQILEKYFEKPPVILSIDVEGKDLEILQSVDFVKWRPLVIVVEMIPYSTDLVVAEKNLSILDFMKTNDYIEFAFTGVNSIFIDKTRSSKKTVNGGSSL